MTTYSDEEVKHQIQNAIDYGKLASAYLYASYKGEGLGVMAEAVEDLISIANLYMSEKYPEQHSDQVEINDDTF